MTLYQTFNACVLQIYLLKKVLPRCSSKFFGSSVPGGDLHIPPPGNADPAAAVWLLHPPPRNSNATLTAEPGWLKALVYWLQYQLMATSFTEPLYKYKEKDPSWEKKKKL